MLKIKFKVSVEQNVGAWEAVQFRDEEEEEVEKKKLKLCKITHD